MLRALHALDDRLLLAVNHARGPALDAVMTFASNRLVWFPFYALLIGWLVWHFRRRALVLLPLVVTAVALADSVTSRWFKPFFARLRPCHTPALEARLYLPDGCGGQFGFMSSHAANGFALAVFLLLTLPAGRYRALKTGVFLWATFLSYSRVYLGAHFPTDVLGGALVGALLGAGAAGLFRRHTAPGGRWGALGHGAA
ncbi:MAG: phosphatase PAP2 family protein [Janthinobacterium lividum]